MAILHTFAVTGPTMEHTSEHQLARSASARAGGRGHPRIAGTPPPAARGASRITGLRGRVAGALGSSPAPTAGSGERSTSKSGSPARKGPEGRTLATEELIVSAANDADCGGQGHG